MNSMSHLGWRAYSLLRLALQPHAFFNQLYRLDWYQAMLREWYTWLQLPSDNRILELGCSSGGFSATLAQHDHRVTGLDHAPRAIRYARQQHGANRLEFVVGDALQLPWQARLFDVSLAASLLNVLDTPQSLLNEMARVTNVDGNVSCLFPNPDLQHNAVKTFIQTHSLSGFSVNALLLWTDVARKLAGGEVTQMFQAAGLTNIRTTTLLQGMVTAIRGKVSS